MSRLLFVIASVCALMASCATNDSRQSARSDVKREGATAQVGPPMDSGDDTPAIGTGIRPADSGLGLTPGFMTPHRPATRQ